MGTSKRVIVYENRTETRRRIGVAETPGFRPRAVTAGTPGADVLGVAPGHALIWVAETDGRTGYLFEPVESRRTIHDHDLRDAIARVEGPRWLEDDARWTYEFGLEPLPESLEGATRMWKRGDVGIIYGTGGVHRFVIRRDGEVTYSESHGRAAAAKARVAGFRFDDDVPVPLPTRADRS
jgi:hypothetical protein